jgi:hypothetical protein
MPLIHYQLLHQVFTSEGQEKLRKNYEDEIAMMQTQITTLQCNLGDAMKREGISKDGEAKARQMEAKLTSVRQVIHSSSAQSMSLTCMIISVLRGEI